MRDMQSNQQYATRAVQCWDSGVVHMLSRYNITTNCIAHNQYYSIHIRGVLGRINQGRRAVEDTNLATCIGA